MSIKVLGFDFGLKRIGVAIGQSLTGTATPLPFLKANQGEPTWEEITKLIKHWRPEKLIVGMPLNIDDTEQAITIEARKFSLKLAQHTGLPVEMFDERLTTKEAKANLFNQGGYRSLIKGKIDSIAACLIIESWLRTQKM